MTEVQITIVLVALVCTVIAIRAYRRIKAMKDDGPAIYKAKPTSELSSDTGRDESQWRRAYSHR